MAQGLAYSRAMTLQPCSRCARHVDSRDVSCPFCGGVVHRREPQPVRAGRFARAAVFAGAALAGCDQGKLPDKAPVEEPKEQPKPARASRVYGVVVDEMGASLVGVGVSLNGDAQTYTTKTDDRGRFEVVSVVPGTYRAEFMYAAVDMGMQRNGLDQREIVIAAGAAQRLEITLNVASHPVAMPYGAPPARRRLV